ncbi:MAG: hypothetical protein ACXVJK_04775 [Candidatus Aminicenantales bacterium]
MEYQILKTAVSEGIATVTVARPQALNALNSRFLRRWTISSRSWAGATTSRS